MGEDVISGKDVAMKAFERLLPAFGYMYAAQVGLLTANVVVLTTWIVSKVRGRKIKSLEDAKREDALRLVELSYLIDEKKKRINELKETLKDADDRQKRVIEAMIHMEETSLEKLIEEHELIQLRLMAIEKLWTLGDQKLIKNVEKIITNIQEGKLDKSQYEVLSQLEELWHKKQLEATTLRRIVEEG